MPIDYTHQHISTDIMAVGTPHTPIDPNGGGGAISVTDGTTTVNPTTSLSVPAGTLTDLGGGIAGIGLAVQQVGPIHIAFDTLGFDGVTTAAEQAPVDCGLLPDGALVLLAWVQVTQGWNGTGSQDAKVFVCDEDGANGTDFLRGWYVANTGGNIPGLYDATSGSSDSWPTFVRNVSGTHLAFQYAAGSTPTAGTADVYAIIATPAP